MIWPAWPASLHCEPQAAANARARSKLQYGSLWLPTNTDGKGKGLMTTGAQLWSMGRNSVRAASPGATKSAPCTRAVLREHAAHAATNKQPKLCATRMQGRLCSSSTYSKRVIQSPRKGFIQSCCCTRW